MSAGKRISAKKVRDLLDARIAVCDDAAGRYERRGQKHQAATERCARLELEYVRGKLFPLQGGDVRGEEKVSIPAGSVESSLRCAPEKPLSAGQCGPHNDFADCPMKRTASLDGCHEPGGCLNPTNGEEK